MMSTADVDEFNDDDIWNRDHPTSTHFLLSYKNKSIRETQIQTLGTSPYALTITIRNQRSDWDKDRLDLKGVNIYGKTYSRV